MWKAQVQLAAFQQVSASDHLHLEVLWFQLQTWSQGTERIEPVETHQDLHLRPNGGAVGVES